MWNLSFVGTVTVLTALAIPSLSVAEEVERQSSRHTDRQVEPGAGYRSEHPADEYFGVRSEPPSRDERPSDEEYNQPETSAPLPAKKRQQGTGDAPPRNEDVGPDTAADPPLKIPTNIITDANPEVPLGPSRVVYLGDELGGTHRWLNVLEWDWSGMPFQGDLVKVKWLHQGWDDFYQDINKLKYWSIPAADSYVCPPRWHPKRTGFLYCEWGLYQPVNNYGNFDIFEARKDISLDDQTKWVAYPVVETPDISEYSPVYSPTGDRIAFATWDGVWVMKSDGSDRKKLTDAFHPQGLAWSPHGSVIAFVASDHKLDTAANDHGWQLYLVAADGSQLVRPFEIEEGIEYWDPAWNHKGNILAFVRGTRGTEEVVGNEVIQVGANWRIWITLVNGLGTALPIQISPEPGVDYKVTDSWPTFSADDSKIIFVRSLNKNYLYSIGMDGDGFSQIPAPDIGGRPYDIKW